MEKETMGTVISVTKQWWLKVNRKPVRAHAMDGAAFPHTIKVKYTIDGKDYICRNGLVQETTFLTREQRLKLPIGKISHRKQELSSNQ